MDENTIVIEVADGHVKVLTEDERSVLIINWDNLRCGDTLPQDIVEWLVGEGHYSLDDFDLGMIQVE